MNILHVFPKKAAIFPAPRVTVEQFEANGFTFAHLPGVSSIWPEEGRTRYHEAHSGLGTVFLLCIDKDKDLWISANPHRDRETFLAHLSRLPDGHLQQFITQNRQTAGDLDGYNREAAVRYEDRRQKQEREKQERQERVTAREREAAELHIRALATARERFERGEKISWSAFEELCKENGIVLHLRTIGAGRKHINAIGLNAMNVSNGSKPDKAFTAARQLHQKLQEHKGE